MVVFDETAEGVVDIFVGEDLLKTVISGVQMKKVPDKVHFNSWF